MAKFYQLGSMKQKREKDENGNVQYYIELDKRVADLLKIDGQKLHNFISVERPTAKFDRMLAAGIISEAEYDQKVADFEKDGKLNFVKFDLSIKTQD